MFRYGLIAILSILSAPSHSTSKCETEWNSLKATQAQLRHNSTEQLRQKEHVRHNAYQNCRKGKSQSKSRNRKTKQYAVSTTNSNRKNKSHILNKRVNREIVGNRQIALKGFFEGEKQNKWLKYYKRPEYCAQPKSTQLFAKCMNHREEEAIKFDELWKKQNLPPKFKLGSVKE